VIVSQSLAGLAGLHVGERLAGTGWPALTVTGIYQLPDLNADYWVLRSTTYFPMESSASLSRFPGAGNANAALFLADAAAAAILAAGAAILGIFLSARRRRYEYAALEASGVRRRTLGGAVLIELIVVLGFGVLAGIATGLAAAAVVLGSVPEFVTSPSAPSLSYVPPAAPLAAALGGAIGLLIIASVATGAMLIRGIRLDQLREAPA
jgi:putative ABC transport system permease protein